MHVELVYFYPQVHAMLKITVQYTTLTIIINIIMAFISLIIDLAQCVDFFTTIQQLLVNYVFLAESVCFH